MELVLLFSCSLFVHEMLTHCLVYRDDTHNIIDCKSSVQR